MVILLARHVFHGAHLPVRIFKEAVDVLRNLSLFCGLIGVEGLLGLQVILLLGSSTLDQKVFLLLENSI